MISDLRSRLEAEKRDDATQGKVSSLTRGLDGRIVMNIKEEDTKARRPKASHHTRKKRKADVQPEAGGGSQYLGEVYSDLTPDQVDTGLSRPHSRRSSTSRRRSRSRDSRRSERREGGGERGRSERREGAEERGRSERRSRRSSRRSSRRESHVR